MKRSTCSVAAFFVSVSGIWAQSGRFIDWPEQRQRLMGNPPVMFSPECASRTQVFVRISIDVSGLVTSAKAQNERGEGIWKMTRKQISRLRAGAELAVKTMAFRPLFVNRKPKGVVTNLAVPCSAAP